MKENYKLFIKIIYKNIDKIFIRKMNACGFNEVTKITTKNYLFISII
ncbi:unnamed protein product [marine sediment metagenome]|uniref:Uncharacterized protein n=1 Tax=marine sediment metagenome TaxID=412755 RepID=X0ZC58_9ZZZZ